MKYVEFYDTTNGQQKLLGEMRIEDDKIVMSEELSALWNISTSYDLLGRQGYETMYDPEKILEALHVEFTDPAFKATEVQERPD